MAKVFQLFQFQFDFRGSVRFQNPLLILYNYLIISKLYIMIEKLIPSEKQLKQLKLKHLASISFI